MSLALAEPLTGPYFPSAAEMAQGAAFFARIQAANLAVQVEAFAISVVIRPDELAPYVLDERAMTVTCPDGDEPQLPRSVIR